MCKNKTGCVILIGLWVTFLIFFSFCLFEIVNFQYKTFIEEKSYFPKGTSQCQQVGFLFVYFLAIRRMG